MRTGHVVVKKMWVEQMGVKLEVGVKFCENGQIPVAFFFHFSPNLQVIVALSGCSEQKPTGCTTIFVSNSCRDQLWLRLDRQHVRC